MSRIEIRMFLFWMQISLFLYKIEISYSNADIFILIWDIGCLFFRFPLSTHVGWSVGSLKVRSSPSPIRHRGFSVKLKPLIAETMMVGNSMVAFFIVVAGWLWVGQLMLHFSVETKSVWCICLMSSGTFYLSILHHLIAEYSAQAAWGGV